MLNKYPIHYFRSKAWKEYKIYVVTYTHFGG